MLLLLRVLQSGPLVTYLQASEQILKMARTRRRPWLPPPPPLTFAPLLHTAAAERGGV